MLLIFLKSVVSTLLFLFQFVPRIGMDLQSVEEKVTSGLLIVIFYAM